MKVHTRTACGEQSRLIRSREVRSYLSRIHLFIFQLKTSGSSPGLPGLRIAASPQGALTVAEAEQNIASIFYLLGFASEKIRTAASRRARVGTSLKRALKRVQARTWPPYGDFYWGWCERVCAAQTAGLSQTRLKEFQLAPRAP